VLAVVCDTVVGVVEGLVEAIVGYDAGVEPGLVALVVVCATVVAAVVSVMDIPSLRSVVLLRVSDVLPEGAAAVAVFVTDVGAGTTIGGSAGVGMPRVNNGPSA
jgi:hypothetical protein